MIRAKYILEFFLLLLSIQLSKAQQLTDVVLDTTIQANEVYLDPVNQIYVINNTEKSISKYDLKFHLLKQISFNQGWDHAVMDVSDPFKCLLFYPGDYKIAVLDASLSPIASYDESELNDQSAVCHYSTDYIGLFSNNVLKLKNYEQQKSISSDPLFNSGNETITAAVTLKQSNDYLYLLRPGIGITRFNNQLFEEKKWLNDKITKMDVSGDQLFCLENGDLIRFDVNLKTTDVIVPKSMSIKSFAVNAEYLVMLADKHLMVKKWK